MPPSPPRALCCLRRQRRGRCPPGSLAPSRWRPHTRGQAPRPSPGSTRGLGRSPAPPLRRSPRRPRPGAPDGAHGCRVVPRRVPRPVPRPTPHPCTVPRALPPSRVQEAPTDAALQLERLRQQRDTRPPRQPQRPPRRALVQLVADRHPRVGEQGRSTHRLPRALQPYFPPGLRWCGEQDPGIGDDFWSRWSTLQPVPLAQRATRETFVRDHPGRSAEGSTQRRPARKAAPPCPRLQAA